MFGSVNNFLKRTAFPFTREFKRGKANKKTLINKKKILKISIPHLGAFINRKKNEKEKRETNSFSKEKIRSEEKDKEQRREKRKKKKTNRQNKQINLTS